MEKKIMFQTTNQMMCCRAWEASTLADLGALHFHLTIGRHGIFLNKPKQ